MCNTRLTNPSKRPPTAALDGGVIFTGDISILTRKEPPEPLHFLLKTPLYEIFEYNTDELEKGFDLYQFDEIFDCYCPECNGHSIFKADYSAPRYYSADAWIDKGRFVISAKCSRDTSHALFFLFEAKGQTIQKIGQLPSLASLHMHDVQKYSKVIEKEYFREFTKAIGLAAHGVGVGSFVYLRRIFETLIEEAHKKASLQDHWNENLYLQSRMGERIEMLAHELPDFLIKNKNMYGILSKGIHELSEQDCLNAFPIVKLGIEMILDERIVAKERAKKLEEATKAMQALSGNM